MTLRVRLCVSDGLEEDESVPVDEGVTEIEDVPDCVSVGV